jgi:hypothetical protein
MGGFRDECETLDMATGIDISYPAILIAVLAYVGTKWWERNQQIADRRAAVYDEYMHKVHALDAQLSQNLLSQKKFEETRIAFAEMRQAMSGLYIFASSAVLDAAYNYTVSLDGYFEILEDKLLEREVAEERLLEMKSSSSRSLAKLIVAIRREKISLSFSDLLEKVKNLKRIFRLRKEQKK